MKNKKKVFSEEFKRKAVNLSNNSQKSLQEIVDELGIGFTNLCKWQNQYLQHGVIKPESYKKPKDHETI
ncbi:MAG: transposase [Spirobacillus cienkowskii]|jgi:transposase|uniref:Transposase n=1 Tax=Spirobacillus cienkowskii TaxID=495820 RepID=A0A369KMH9_9BACT|nr:MAG: transposase [Spirobacillus cienkowskii]